MFKIESDNTFSYSSIAKRFVNILTKPKSEFDKIFDEKTTRNEIILEYQLPIIAFCSLVQFVFTILTTENEPLLAALKYFSGVFLGLYGTLILTVFTFKQIISHFKIEIDNDQVYKIVGYSMSPLFVTVIVSAFCNFIIAQILSWYVLILVFIALGKFSTLNTGHKIITSLITFLVNISAYYLIWRVLGILISLTQ